MDFGAIRKYLQSTRQLVPFGIVLALAVALKRYYSLTEAGGLVWVLEPTARLVGFMTGIPFVFEQGTGFVNLGHRAVIAPACAGLNFMIIAFCMAGFSLIRNCTSEKTRLAVIPAALAAAYCLTIAVNSLRIGLAVWLYDADVSFGWFTRERIHQLAGTLVYFAGLCCVYSLINCPLIRKNRTVAPAVARRLLTPAMWYLAVTLAVPVILGKFSVYRGRLVEHGLFVVAIPVIIILCCWFKDFAGKKDRVRPVKL